MLLLLLLTLFTFGNGAFAKPSSASCGYQSCPETKKGFINLHLVPHTHNDVGWLKTYDQYYYGSNNSIQDAGVQYILDSVIRELYQDSKRRFIYVETAFFWIWWKEQDEETKLIVKNLVNSGRLEIIGGGWSMNDEATTHYQSIIDQFSWGLRRLDSALGPCGRPRIGWQIDPFGHSRESAAIMAKMGFDGLFLGRIDWEDKENRLKNKSMEVIWYTDPFVQGDEGKLFTGVMYNTYSSPPRFCFDTLCPDEPIIDDIESPNYNAYQRASDFLSLMNNYSRPYRTKNVLVTMGEDFVYQNAHKNFKNMDKLIKQINKQSNKYYAFYSTPSCYLKAVHEQGVSFPIKEDDYLPYSSDPYSFWSGYFTSRPTIKRYERLGNNFLQIVKQASVIGKIGETEPLIELREAMGVMQHHDAVTGTEKQHVANDYSRILSKAIDASQTIIEQAFSNMMGSKLGIPLQMSSCLLNNVSSCPLTEKSDTVVITVYNPLSRPVSRLVRLPITSKDASYTVTDPHGNKLETQCLVVPDPIKRIPGRPTPSGYELAWLAKGISPLGFTSYHVTKGAKMDQNTFEIPFNPGKPTTVGYKEASITLNSNGILKSVKMGDRFYPMNQLYAYYIPTVGDNRVAKNRSSGAYIFRANGSDVPINTTPKVKIYNGPLVTEVHQIINDWISQIIRTVRGSDIVEFQWLVGPIPLENKVGKEIIWRIQVPNMKTGGIFETDSNGRQHLQRKLNHRDDWRVHLAEKVPGNYYPITTDISINGNGRRITVVTDRAQGGSSLQDGEIELMLHRRLTHDDAFGVGEALNETAFGEPLVARGSLWLMSGSADQARRTVQELSVLSTWTFITQTNLTFDEWKTILKMEVTALSVSLPQSVQILTLEPWKDGDILLRLEHLSTTYDEVTIEFKDMFSMFKVIGVEEMTIDGNKMRSEVNRFKWKEYISNIILSSTINTPATTSVTLKPMEIRTFILHVKYTI